MLERSIKNCPLFKINISVSNDLLYVSAGGGLWAQLTPLGGFTLFDRGRRKLGRMGPLVSYFEGCHEDNTLIHNALSHFIRPLLDKPKHYRYQLQEMAVVFAIRLVDITVSQLLTCENKPAST